MKKFFVSKSVRLRGSSFTSRIEKQGVKSYTVYNHMLLPTTFSSPEDEYKHLKTHVQVWDVSVQREIEITGRFSQALQMRIEQEETFLCIPQEGLQQGKTRSLFGKEKAGLHRALRKLILRSGVPHNSSPNP